MYFPHNLKASNFYFSVFANNAWGFIYSSALRSLLPLIISRLSLVLLDSCICHSAQMCSIFGPLLFFLFFLVIFFKLKD